MFTVYPQASIKPEEKHSLPPLSQIISNVLPFQHDQQKPRLGSFSHQGQSLPQQIPVEVCVQELAGKSNTSLNKCSCKQEGNHIPRPRNAFILFRQQHHQSVLDEGDTVKTNPDVSRELGKRWRDLSAEEKDYWNKLAEEEKKRHAEKYPGYRYIPRRFGKKNKCPTCKSRAHMKEIDAHEQRIRILDLQEEELKARLATFQTQTPPNKPTEPVQSSLSSNLSRAPSLTHSASNTPDDSTKLYNSASSEEHAIAQSFLSLRNQPQHYYPPQQQYYHHQTPAQQSAYYPPSGGFLDQHQHSQQQQQQQPQQQHQQQHHHHNQQQQQHQQQQQQHHQHQQQQRSHHPQHQHQQTQFHAQRLESQHTSPQSSYQNSNPVNELPRLHMTLQTASPSKTSPTEDKQKICSIASFLN
jgi:HMG box factor